jgi:hypothetical protein
MANRDGGSSSLATLLAGAVIGAAGLAWWLLSEADQRRQRSQRSVRFGDAETDSLEPPGPMAHPLREWELQDKVHQLNQAIDDVRRQLESLSTPNQS